VDRVVLQSSRQGRLQNRSGAASDSRSALLHLLGILRRLQGGSWSPWDTLGRAFISKPHAATWQHETLTVFALGADSAIWWWNNVGWASLGGTFISPPFAVATPDHVHVFAIGAAKSDLQHRQWNGSQWSDWESFGGILFSPPTAVDTTSSPGTERQLVYTVGADSAAWKIGVFNESSSIWESLGGTLLSSPNAALSQTILVFVVGLLSDHTVGLLIDR
jgi:hypothetical protein